MEDRLAMKTPCRVHHPCRAVRAASLVAALALGALPAPAAAQRTTVASGPLAAHVEHEPFRLAFADARGALLEDAPSDGDATGAIGFRDAGGWRQAVRVAETRQLADGRAARLVLETDDPAGRRIDLRVAPRGEGVIEVAARVLGADAAGAEILALGAAWRARAGERFFGLGQRANALEHRGADVESYVSDGPYREDEWVAIGALLPPPGFRRRADATYFPIPWILSSAGYGVVVANDDTAYHRLVTERPDAWSFEVRGAPDGMGELPAPRTLTFLVFAGPQPADALRRFTRWSGRQPALEAPWAFGPWYQPGGPVDEQRAQVEALRAADAPLSVAQTYLHYLPCGSSRAREKERTSALHALGVAVTTYFNPMLCEEYDDAFRHAVRTRALVQRPDGEPYLYTYFTSRAFVVGQYDFGFVGGRRAFQQLLSLAVDDGHDGWMEDFGEYTPLDAALRDGTTGSAAHNRYVVDYHCTAWDFARRQRRPIVRFQRSGWTGASRCAQVVWGGDPTTDWGFDGLASAVRSGVGMGLSGVGTWGSDVGGFFSFNGRQLDDELLTRWIQLGAVSGVMRTQRDGLAVPAYERPQVDDEQHLAVWRRYAKLRTQLYPYVAAAADDYRRSGVPIMRHLVLAYPDDANVLDRDDQFLFGPDLLAAPVLEPGATTRTAYLPAGEWIDFWRAVRFVEEDGSLALGRAEPLAGGRTVTVPAPLEELPLFVRAGALLALLPPDVDTLADYGAGTPDLVRLDDRRGDRRLLAFPRGDSTVRLAHGALASRERADRWELALDAPVARWSIEASLATLERPFAPCAVEWSGRPLGAGLWSYDDATGVLHAEVAGSGALVVRRTCGPG
jgi:alpha-glucosidase (family GH31 glycosyl hydrolase)